MGKQLDTGTRDYDCLQKYFQMNESVWNAHHKRYEENAGAEMLRLDAFYGKSFGAWLAERFNDYYSDQWADDRDAREADGESFSDWFRYSFLWSYLRNVGGTDEK